MLKCLHCQISFSPSRTNNSNPQKFCSRLCSSSSKKTKQLKDCLYCGEETCNPKFCSSACSASYNNTGFRRHSKPNSKYSSVKKCKTCGNETARPVYCSDKCNPRKQPITEEILKQRKAKKNEAWHRYMARKKNQTPENEDISKLQEFYINCPPGYEVDHIIPISKGGLHTISNLQYLTISENRKKSNKILAGSHGDDPRSEVLETTVLPT